MRSPHFITLSLLLIFLLSFTGCKSEEDEAWQKAYDANYSAGYNKGFQEGDASGKKDGEQNGIMSAHNAAQTGGAWQLYLTLAIWTLVIGVITGLFIQYAILLACRISGRLPQLSTVAFVPAMKRSYSYSIFERRRQSIVEMDEALREMGERRNLQVAQIKVVHDALEEKIKATSSLEELSLTRIVDLANKEFSKIISASEVKTGQIKISQQIIERRSRISYICPHCHKKLGYKEQLANKTTVCPNPECGQPITLPPLLMADDEEPSIIIIEDE